MEILNYTISILMKLSPTVRYTEEYLHKYSSKTRDKKTNYQTSNDQINLNDQMKQKLSQGLDCTKTAKFNQ